MSILRACGGPLAALLADGSVELMRADLFTFTLADGSTVYRWTSWDKDLTDGVHTWTSQNPWISRSGFKLSNTMVVPDLTIELLSKTDAFNGGPSLKAQLRDGLFDGATVLCETLFMQTAGDFSLGTIGIFSGVTGQIDMTEVKTTIKCKGKNNLLDQFAPRNVYQLPCNHAFCDPGCTLLRAAFTTAYTMGGTPTKTFIPWSAAPGTPSRYILGSFKGTSGAAAGMWRTIINADATGLTLIYPLSRLPLNGDTFTAFEGCDKTTTRCTALANLQHFRGFPFQPPPDAAW